MDHFTPLSSLLGGAMIGAAALLLLAGAGRIAGISGIAARLLPPGGVADALPRFLFLLGLVLAPLLYAAATGRGFAPVMQAHGPLLLLAGLLVGFGAVWGNGCTSGHGVCGLSRLSVRSLVATVVFMAAGFLTVWVMRHV
ncbi:YeeE/YedE family protein [Rhodovarius lipocyclicus]|uniref:YeeE/YedE family protein n=1 Tax=Rhodovarius lipocyclicus TaxID=268410 RepID=UPI00135B99CB|nr:YeeE/YedE thiosulfate transporter family protein [Rhodovarius lipocyclicus]